jgi:hypothetical protein
VIDGCILRQARRAFSPVFSVENINRIITLTPHKKFRLFAFFLHFFLPEKCNLIPKLTRPFSTPALTQTPFKMISTKMQDKQFFHFGFPEK